VPDAWTWDQSLFEGAAPYYAKGRLPYAPGLASALAEALALDGTGRLLDVGCGPGIVALKLAHLFAEVVGLDPDPGMLTEAARRARDLGIGNAQWVQARGEDLPEALGPARPVRVATFAQSFHWMDRDRVAAAVRRLLEPGGAFVQVSRLDDPDPDEPLPHPRPPMDAVQDLIHRFLGPDRRAGQGIRTSSPGDEPAVLARAGFPPLERVVVPGREVLVRTVDEVVAHVFSMSSSAPHLYGEAVDDFERSLRDVLSEASPDGLFAERTGDTELRIWRRPGS
jgi:SAM-dependent methyltransferase